jgi:DNA invertase Pin-like site-specific DNA recombinase
MRVLAKEVKVDDFTARMFDAINGMMLAAIARKDYEDCRRRQMQGQGCWQVRRPS